MPTTIPNVITSANGGSPPALMLCRALADYYEAVMRAGSEPKVAANWVMGEVLARLRDAGIGISECRVTPARLAAAEPHRAEPRESTSERYPNAVRLTGVT